VGSPPHPRSTSARQRGQRRATRPRHLINDHRMGRNPSDSLIR
jgi:hypothetical protein